MEENNKRALKIYETTGMFVAACRHGLIQKLCEMVNSGELYVALEHYLLQLYTD